MVAYREGGDGGRGKGQWFWKLPVADLIDIGRHDSFKGATSALNKDSGSLNHNGQVEEGELGIDKPYSLKLPPTEGKAYLDCQSFKSASVPTVDEVGTLKDCIHDFASGKGCYVCDPNHPYRLEQGNKT